MDMGMQLPEDLGAARARSGHNVNHVERWGSVAAGAALALYGLNQRRSSGWLSAALGAALVQRGVTGHCHVYGALGVSSSGSRTDTRRALGGRGGVLVEESVTINRPIEDLYVFWRNLDNLPRFMHHLESVEQITDTLSRWRAKGPGGHSVEWNAEIINEIPNQLIGWRSLEGSEVVSAGSVTFGDAGSDRGTRIRVRLQYSPPGGKVGAAVAKLMGRDPAQEIREDLRTLKQLMETGELATTKGQPRG